MMYNYHSVLFSLSVAFALVPVASVKAQLLPDNTLGKENSVINSINSLEDRIDGGAIRGANLFHSFKEFNIDNGKSVYFSSPTAIKNILTRVTGNNQSQILGKLGVLGNANLFLINPKGIIFGKDASLDINGSFVGSTAANVLFEDGFKFSAVSPDKPLLTISVPVGLGLDNPGDIKVQGDGHNFVGSAFIPLKNHSTKVLEVNPGKTIALIGGNIILDGGSLKTESGRVELGSVGSGQVDFNLTPGSLKFSYNNAETFQDIKLSNKAALDANSSFRNTSNLRNDLDTNLVNSNSIQLQGKNIYLSDNSIILNNNQSNLPSGNININAKESFEMRRNSVVRSQALVGEGGNIAVSAKQVLLADIGGILAFNYGDKSGGNIKIKASDSVNLIGVTTGTEDSTTIVTNTFSNGDGGNIDISTSRLNVMNGGLISSSGFGGNAGNLIINASESVEVVGIEPNFLQPSVLTSVTLGNGNGGNLTLNTKRLIVKDGGRVDASTVANGAAGSITINASEKIELTGSDPQFLVPSLIASSAIIEDEIIQKRFGLPSVIEGKSGQITINTGQLNIADGALLIVKNDGSGDAGILKVTADSINIDNKSSISAANKSGEGGNIDLQTQNLLLRRNSNISATSAGTGDGGNINIDTKILAALENSDITANSEGSFGGRVEINAKGIFGTQFREFLTPESDIAATSGLGAEFNGVVDINTITINPNSGLVELPTGLTDSSSKIKAGCSVNSANIFTATGRGGLPENPNQLFTVNNPVVDVINLVSISENNSNSISSNSSTDNHKKDKKAQKEIVEAKGWVVDAKGNVEFVAEIPSTRNNSDGIQAANCQSLS
ncbi:MAG: filamentous hemagglutinin N-terminal domain-containing protein [Cyanobacteria bacterium J06621_15]